MRKRQVWVEPLFGEGKQWHQMRWFRLRRLRKVNIEGLMRAAGQNIKRLLKHQNEPARPLAQENSQTLRVRAVEDLVVSGDENQLRRAVRNLLNNAIKYTHSGGKILCECRVQNGNYAPEDAWPGASDVPAGLWAALRVADTGTGISVEHLPKVFDRFYRVNVQGNVPGVGLGLSIAKELVELHEGHIAASSTPGKGSVFAIYLPLSKE